MFGGDAEEAEAANEGERGWLSSVLMRWGTCTLYMRRKGVGWAEVRCRTDGTARKRRMGEKEGEPEAGAGENGLEEAAAKLAGDLDY